MGSYNQMAKLNVESKDSAFVTKFKINIDMAETLGKYNSQPKKRQQLIQAIIRDIQIAKDKKLAYVNSYGYIEFEDTAYNPDTGVLIFSYGKRDSYTYNETETKDYRFVFTKPVVKLTEDEIYNRNTEPVVTVSNSTKKQFRSWYGPKTEKFTIKRYCDSVIRLFSEYYNSKGEYNGSLTEEQFKLLNSTPKIVYYIMPLMLGVKPHTLLDKFTYLFGRSDHDKQRCDRFVRVLKYAQIQEESNTPIMPKDERNNQENIVNSLKDLRDDYMGMLQMFDTTMRHRVGLTPTYCYQFSYNNDAEVETYGYIPYTDDRFNFREGYSCNIPTINKVKVPTNDSLLRLKQVLDEMNFKEDISWTRNESVIAILEAIESANIEYDEIEIEPVNNMRNYPFSEFCTEWLYNNPKAYDENAAYKLMYKSNSPRNLVGIGYKKDLMTIYNILTEIASRNNYFADILYESKMIVKGFKPEFKLDNEVFKGTLNKVPSDAEIETALNAITEFTSKIYGADSVEFMNIREIEDRKFYTECEALRMNEQVLQEDKLWTFPRITFNTSNVEEFEEFRRYVRAVGLLDVKNYEGYDGFHNVNLQTTAEKDRQSVINVIVINSIYGNKHLHKSKIETDGFITVERMSHSDVIDTDFNEISE